MNDDKLRQITTIVADYAQQFRDSPKTVYLSRLADSLCQKYAPHEVKRIFVRAVETLTHFPSVSQCEQLAAELEVHTKRGWRYLEVADCLRCGGLGWHWVRLPNGAEGTVACDDCRAGKALQMAPKGMVTHTLAKCPPGTEYLAPGRAEANRPMHERLKARLDRKASELASDILKDMPMNRLDWKP